MGFREYKLLTKNEAIMLMSFTHFRAVRKINLGLILLLMLGSALFPASGQAVDLIVNGQFGTYDTALNADGAFTNPQADSIFGWTYTATGGGATYGINNAAIRNYVSPAGLLPTGSVAFLRNESTLSTMVDGLVPGEKYVLSFQYSSQAGNTGAYNGSLQATLGGTVLLPNQTVPFYDSTSTKCNFYNYYYEFTPAAGQTSMTLAFETKATGLTTLANVSVVPIAQQTGGWVSQRFWENDASLGIEAGNIYTHAYNFHNNPVELNGLTFKQISSNATVGSLKIVGGGNHGHGTATSLYSDAEGSPTKATYALTTNSIFSSPTLTLSNLIAGMEYEIQLLGSNYGYTQNRNNGITVNGESRSVFRAVGYQDTKNVANEGFILTWQGEANQLGQIVIALDGVNTNDTFHLVGLTSQFISKMTDGLIMATTFAGVSGEYGGAGTWALNQTKLDHYNYFGADKKWSVRGNGQGRTPSVWWVGSANNDYLKNVRKISEDAMAVVWGNSAIAIDFAADQLPYDTITLSAELTVNGVGGIGMGFFDSTNGNNTLGDSMIGFTGVVMDTSGNLTFRSNYLDSLGDSKTDISASIGYLPIDETFNFQDMYHLTMDILLNDDGTGELIGLSLEGSAADYSELYGFSFDHLDLVGFMSLAGDWGAVNNFVVTGAFSPNAAGDVPEPATWVMLLMAAGWLGFRSVRRKK